MWTEAPVAQRIDWAEGLFTLQLDTELAPFAAGQWTRLALDVDGEVVRRAYSLSSAPGAPPEFFLTRVEGGALTPHLHQLKRGDRVQIEQQPMGYFTLAEVPDAAELWMIATGTGLGPFVSMLRTEEPWLRFQRIVLVHGVRAKSHLAYAQELAELSAVHEDRLRYVSVVSREPGGRLPGRITQAFEGGLLEQAADTPMAPDRTHVMLCGNPEMIREMQTLLAARGLERHRRRKPGHVTIEKYW